jgi:hypothetical protein
MSDKTGPVTEDETRVYLMSVAQLAWQRIEDVVASAIEIIDFELDCMPMRRRKLQPYVRRAHRGQS